MTINLRESFAERSLRGRASYSSDAFRGVVQELFPETHVLLPQINQIYELDMAYGEYARLTDAELVTRGAYFQRINGIPSHHFQMCMTTPDQVNASARQDRKNFFAANVFAVGYATHGLFPYRGKFHPQMIKAVMNMMGLKPGSTVLDPMAGCGTTSIEASIIGVDSIASEVSPFACLMTRAKTEALDMDWRQLSDLLEHAQSVYEEIDPYGRDAGFQTNFFSAAKSTGGGIGDELLPSLPRSIRELLLLCYLDAVGYAARRKGKTPRDLFPELLSRYLAAVRAFNETREALGLPLGRARVVEGDARDLRIPDESIDGIVFSPPYSFAIDYVENDRGQLEFLGVDVDELKKKMIGLIGSGKTNDERIASRVNHYFRDIEQVIRECERVLRPRAYCVIIVGSNTNQTGGVSLEDELVRIASRVDIPLEFQIMRQIEGIRNTMRDEYLLFLRKP